MSILAPIGRVLFSLIFILSLPSLFTNEAIARAAAAGVPYAQYLVPLAGVVAFLGGLMVALGLYARLGAFLILLFLVPVTLFMHRFWVAGEPGEQRMQFVNFMKNVSLSGAAIYLIYAGASMFSIDHRRYARIGEDVEPHAHAHGHVRHAHT